MTPDYVQPGTRGPGLIQLPAVEVAERFGLQPHREGGHYREVYRSPVEVQTEAGLRPLATAVLYLVTAQEPSRFHRLRSDEVWFYHAGAPVEMVFLDKGKVTYEVVGQDAPQVVVPGGCWMGARVLTQDQADWGSGRAPERRWTPDRRSLPDVHWALVGCVVSPGFDFEDFELADQATLLREYPQARKEILALT